MQNLINASEYIKSPEDMKSLNDLMIMFEKNIKPDEVRNRAYLKLIWNRYQDKVITAPNQAYFQSANSNKMDGGKVRQFAVMDKAVLDLPIMQNILHYNLQKIKAFPLLKHHPELIFGLHFIQYKVDQYGASYSSPDYLHLDDEPLVFVHLLNLTHNAWGGDNLIADLKTRKIINVVRLEKPLDTIVLTRDYYHAVTALGAREGEARRDILLFTVEPIETQVETAA